MAISSDSENGIVVVVKKLRWTVFYESIVRIHVNINFTERCHLTEYFFI